MNLHCCAERKRLARRQQRRVGRLRRELNRLVGEGNDYHARFIQADLVAAGSLARLIHRCGEKKSPDGFTS